MSVFSILKEIFTENTGHDVPVFLPKKLTKHYHNEISKCFLDEVYIATEYRHIEKILLLYKYQSHREYGIIFEDLYKELLKYIFSDT